MIVVTPSLWVGTEDEAVGKDLFYALTAKGAVHTIVEGAIAVIPTEGWEDMARDVLDSLDADEDRVDWAISFAKGEVKGSLEF